ncbi:MAG: 4Fe-4S binding protein [Phycisphaerales bacterium]
MIELPVLNHQFDEERAGFPEPARAAPKQRSVGEYAMAAIIGLGLLAFVLCGLWGWGRGSWWALLLSFGLPAVATAGFFITRYRGTVPGIKHNDTRFRDVQSRGITAWMIAVFLTGFYIVLYWYADLQARGLPAVFEGPIRLLDPLAMALTGEQADHWFLYGTLYTLAILTFGVRMFLKYRHNRYQIIRNASVMFFQLGLAFILPGILRRLHQPEYYVTYFWPLKPEYAWPGGTHSIIENASGFLGWIMIGFGLFAILVLTPLLTYFYGKRWYCSWVCGCGGLAETLGDPWRQLSDKSPRAWKIERVLIYSVLIFIILVTGLLWFDNMTRGEILGGASLAARKWYGFLVVGMFAGVIGVGFYPLMGSRVWCRFGCPMAAILGILQRTFSRFRITTNGDQCMSCGNCSTYCEMGIDVRAYAQRGENIVRASCVGCGICAAVCPRGVLKLENGMTHHDRYDNEAGNPLAQVIADIRNGTDAH